MHVLSATVAATGNVSTLSGQSSPRPHRSSRPLSAVFQNIHPPNIWRHRKGTLSFTQVFLQHRLCFFSPGALFHKVTHCPLSSLSSVGKVTVSEEGSISGSLHRTKQSKRSWKRLWFLLKDKVLYTYRAQEVRQIFTGALMETGQDPHPQIHSCPFLFSFFFCRRK